MLSKTPRQVDELAQPGTSLHSSHPAADFLNRSDDPEILDGQTVVTKCSDLEVVDEFIHQSPKNTLSHSDDGARHAHQSQGPTVRDAFSKCMDPEEADELSCRRQTDPRSDKLTVRHFLTRAKTQKSVMPGRKCRRRQLLCDQPAYEERRPLGSLPAWSVGLYITDQCRQVLEEDKLAM